MPKARTAARGYGQAHQLERKRWAPKVATGNVNCARCGQPIQPGRPWDLGHNDERTAWTGPEHRSCNRTAGGRNGAMVSNALRRTKPIVRQSREW